MEAEIAYHSTDSPSTAVVETEDKPDRDVIDTIKELIRKPSAVSKDFGGIKKVC